MVFDVFVKQLRVFFVLDFNKRESEDSLIDLNFLGIDNVLELWGDAAKKEASFEPEAYGHKYAIDLQRLKKSRCRCRLYLDPDVFW